MGPLLLAFLSTAFATPNYPGVIYTHLGLEVAPVCTLCHETNLGGLGTVVTPFGLELYGRGLRADDPDTLEALLDDLEAEGTDSDADGKGDIDELRDGTDPNGGSVDLIPKYGCLSAVRQPAGLGWAMLALGAVVVRRRPSRLRGRSTRALP